MLNSVLLEGYVDGMCLVLENSEKRIDFLLKFKDRKKNTSNILCKATGVLVDSLIEKEDKGLFVGTKIKAIGTIEGVYCLQEKRNDKPLFIDVSYIEFSKDRRDKKNGMGNNYNLRAR